MSDCNDDIDQFIPERDERKFLSYDTFGDTIINHKEWNSDTYDLIVEGIDKGETPEGAAIQAGLTIRLFREWMQIESFRMMIEGLVANHRSKLRREIEQDTELIYLPKDRVAMKIKHAERIDPDYGMKHIEIDEKRKSIPDPVGSIDEEGKAMLDAAKKAANG